MKCKCQAIIFDFDGVIVESADIKTRAYAQLYKEYGPEVVGKVVEYNLIQGGLSRYEHFRYFHRDILKKDLGQEEEIQLAEKFSELVKNATINAPFVPGIIEFLDKYKNIIDFYIVSGTPEEELRYIVDMRNMIHYFKGIYGSPQTKASIITNILLFSNIEKEDVVMIGDSMTDYDGAMTVEIPFIGRISQFRKDILPRDLFPKAIAAIRDFNDKMSLHMALFQ